MVLELKRGRRTAQVDTHGGELVSYRDETGLEYIWTGDPAYWTGRNPLLFPIVGGLREDKIRIGDGTFSMARHGFARRSEFTVKARGEDWAELELTENEATLALYPFPFRLTVRQQLTDGGFTTAATVTNTGDRPMPFCLGAHTGFRCPLEEGEGFTDYEVKFNQKETCPTLVPENGTLDRPRTRPCLEDSDVLPLTYAYFDEMDTLIFQGLQSQQVELRSKKSGKGVRMSFPGFPVLALWSTPGKAAPYLCIEPWHGLPPVAGEGPQLTDKAFCITLSPGQSHTLRYQVDTL